MGTRKTGLSTILIVDPEHGKTRSIQVKTSHIRKFKSYLLYTVLVFLSMAGTIVVMSYTLIEKEDRISKIMKKISMQHTVPLKDTIDAKDYIQAIELKLKRINTYLIKRGVPGFSITALGGKATSLADLPDRDSYKYYEEHISRIDTALFNLPVGYPASRNITSSFGIRNNPFDFSAAEFHPGIDFKGKLGENVRCTASGEVIFSGWLKGYGRCVRIRHLNGYETLFGHLSVISLKAGEKVAAGQLLGKVGSSGRSTGNHLHYEVRKNNKVVNPRDYLTLN